MRKLDGAPEILSLEPKNIADILDSIEIVGSLTGSSLAAQSISSNIRARIDKIRKSLIDIKRIPKVLMLEWLDPPFVGGHWIPEMISTVGAVNAYDLTNQPSREAKWQELLQEEIDKLLDNDRIINKALEDVEQNGIVFIDEIDKITSRSEKVGADVSREGVQRDLLPLIEGTTVSTKHGVVKTDYILFITAGAFHASKPSDMLPELQGRLPIRVELESLSKDDFKLILTETQNSLIKQYIGLLGTEKVELIFDNDGIDKIAELASEINQNVENIGARRLHTIMEKLLEDISYNASDIGPQKVNINTEYVEKNLGEIIKSQDLSKFIL